jgi:hypothetical protein
MIKKIFIVSFALIMFLSLSVLVQAESTTGGTLNPGLVTGMEGVIIAAPTASPVAGTYHATQSVTLTAAGSTAICYTTDDTTPVCNGTSACTTGTKYSSAISVTLTDTIKSIACYADGSSGPVATDTYTLTCSTASVTNGTVGAYPGCAITCNSGYTLSGSTCVASGGGGGGGGTAITPTPTTPTTTTGQVTATASGGGKTTVSSSDGSAASVQVPVGTVGASTNFKIEPITKTSESTSGMVFAIGSGQNIVGNYLYNYSATVGTDELKNFSKSVTITITYTEAQIANLDESSLVINYWDEDISEWVALTTTINRETNTATAYTDHFTYFALMGEEGETGAIVDGDLIRNPSAVGMAQFDIYIVKLIGNKKFKRLILSPHVFESYEHFDKNGNGSPWDDVLDVAQSVMDDYTDSDLVRVVGGTNVYKLVPTGDTGTKQWLNMTAEKFVSDGYDADSIYEINATDRDAYVSGENIGDEGVSETIIINTSFLRIRSIPSTSGDVLGEVNEGEVYNLLDEENGWYKITVNGVTGWCYGANGEYASKQ